MCSYWSVFTAQVSYPIAKSRTYTKASAVQASVSAQSLKTTLPQHSNQDQTDPGDSFISSRKVSEHLKLCMTLYH